MKLAIINTSAPYGNNAGQEALDLAMACGSFGQETSLFFVNDGVWQLVNNQQANLLDRKQYTNGFAALPFYDIDQIIVCAESLRERRLKPKQLNVEAEVLPLAELNLLLTQHQHILRF